MGQNEVGQPNDLRRQDGVEISLGECHMRYVQSPDGNVLKRWSVSSIAGRCSVERTLLSTDMTEQVATDRVLWCLGGLDDASEGTDDCVSS